MGSFKAHYALSFLLFLSVALCSCRAPGTKSFVDLSTLPSTFPEAVVNTKPQNLTCVVSLDVSGDVDGDINVDNHCKPIISPEQIQIEDPRLKALALSAHKSLIDNRCEQSHKEYLQAAELTNNPILLGYFGSRIEYARQCIERNVRVVEKALNQLNNSEEETGCKDFSGYAKGSWRGFIEYGYVSARLCQKSPLKGQFTFHWYTGTVSSYVNGVANGNVLHLEEPRERGNGEMKLTQIDNILSGTYHYYQNEYLPYEIKLIERGLPQELYAFNTENINKNLHEATENDPILTLVKNLRVRGFPEPHYLLNVEEASTMFVKIADESLDGDTFAGMRKIITLQEDNEQWQSVNVSEELKCGEGKNARYRTAPCP